MVEPISAAAAVVYGTKKFSDGLQRLLGPSADEVAEALRRLTASRLRKVGRVIENANKKTIGDAEAAGAIPSRVALRVLDEATYSDDELIVEYLGGVLASSRTPAGRDDRGNTLTLLVARLSTYSLRSHYIFYAEFCRCLHKKTLNVYDANDLNVQAKMFVPYRTYQAAMEFSQDEHPDAIGTSCLYGLKQEGLLSFVRGGAREYLQVQYPNIPEAGVIVEPTVAGVELFLWALGFGQAQAREFLRLEPQETRIAAVPWAPGALLISDIEESSATEGEPLS